MTVRIEDFGGKQEARNLSEYEAALESRFGPRRNGFWIWHEEEIYPALSLLVAGELATILYFPFDGHPGFASDGKIEGLDKHGSTIFSFDRIEQEQEFPNYQVVPLVAAMSAAKEFFASKQLPTSIEWNEL
jgi:hypothetical protein